MSGRVQACVCWPSCVTLIAAPLQDSGSLERRKPISLNSQRAAQRDTEVLHSNFTAINPHHSDGAGGSGRRQPEGKEMGSDSGRTPLYPILLDLLFSPRRGSQRLSWKHTQKKKKKVYLHSFNLRYSHTFLRFPSHKNKPTHADFCSSTHHALRGFFYICISSRPGESAPTASSRELVMTERFVAQEGKRTHTHTHTHKYTLNTSGNTRIVHRLRFLWRHLLFNIQ